MSARSGGGNEPLDCLAYALAVASITKAPPKNQKPKNTIAGPCRKNSTPLRTPERLMSLKPVVTKAPTAAMIISQERLRIMEILESRKAESARKARGNSRSIATCLWKCASTCCAACRRKSVSRRYAQRKHRHFVGDCRRNRRGLGPETSSASRRSSRRPNVLRARARLRRRYEGVTTWTPHPSTMDQPARKSKPRSICRLSANRRHSLH